MQLAQRRLAVAPDDARDAAEQRVFGGEGVATECAREGGEEHGAHGLCLRASRHKRQVLLPRVGWRQEGMLLRR